MTTHTNPARQAMIVWGIFFIINILINGTIPFLLGADLHDWKASVVSSLLYGFIQYGIMFLLVPLILVKGWMSVRQPAFLIPLGVAMLAISLSLVYRGVMVIALVVIGYLHWRFDLSDLGIRSLGWKGDLIAVLLLGLFYSLPQLIKGFPSLNWSAAWAAGMDRWFANPASSVENLFYFGYLTERIAPRTGRWIAPFLIGAMYTAHGMTNPGYWYQGMNFSLVFIGIAFCTFIYLWRRSVVVIWLGDGLSRWIGKLF